MKILHFLFIFFLFVNALLAQNYTREYTYNASENDSKLSARKAALEALKVELIEELGIEVASTTENITHIKDKNYEKMLKTNLRTFSVAITKTKVLDESWNGEKFWLKALVSVDKKSLTKALNKQLVKEQEKRLDKTHEHLRQEIRIGLYNLRTPQKIRALTTKAVRLPMQGKQNIKAHQNILHTFTKYSLHDTLYRDFLFQTIKHMQPTWKEHRAFDIFRYIARIKMYSKKEQKIVLDFLARMPRHMQGRYYRDVFKNLNASHEELYKLSDAYLHLVFNKEVGRPVAINFEKELKTFLKALPKPLALTLEEKWSKQ